MPNIVQTTFLNHFTIIENSVRLYNSKLSITDMKQYFIDFGFQQILMCNYSKAFNRSLIYEYTDSDNSLLGSKNNNALMMTKLTKN